MKERFVCGAQAMSMRGPEYNQATSGAAMKGGEQPCPPAQSEEALAVCPRNAPCPLTTFLTRSEFVPYILEQEKSLLVLKEHDYAKAPDRAAVLQASSILGREAEVPKSSGEANGSSASPKPVVNDEFLCCFGELTRLRYNVLRSDEGRASKHLREVVRLQAALVREQQEQLYTKERELASIRKERDQLEARLERMERRLAVHQKRNTANLSEPDGTSPAPTPTPNVSKRLSRAESLIVSESHTRSRSSSLESSKGRIRPSSQPGTPTTVEDGVGGKRSAKKRLRTEENSVPADPTPKRVKKAAKLSEVRTKMEYKGLDLSWPAQDCLVSNSVSSVNHVDAVEKSKKVGKESPSNTNTNIMVPSWRLCPVTNNASSETPTDPEDLTDEAFVRRHKKHEEDEKRRKRWDLQRARALLEHEELLKKYNKKSGADQLQQEKKKDRVTSLLPKIEEVEELEVVDTVVVSAFGHPIPLLKRSDFVLPWFDLDIREARENVRTTRSKARASRTSAGSSDDS